MARITTRLGLNVWDEEPDYYNHVELYSNWDQLDNVVLNRTGDTATGTIRVELAAASDVGFATLVDTDTEDRVQITGEGIAWGPGNDVQDITLKRTGVGTVTFIGRLKGKHATFAPWSGGQDADDPFIENTQDGDTDPLFTIRGDGRMGWGPGNDDQDTFMYRDAPGVLKVVNTIEADNLGATEISIDGNTIKFEDGALSLEVPFVTDGYIAARNSHSGRVRLGDPGDPNQAIVSFGSGPNASIFMTDSPSLRLKTNNVFETANLVTPLLNATNGTVGGLTVTTLTSNGQASFKNNVGIDGTLNAQGGSFSNVDVRAGVITSSGASALTLNKNVTIPSAHKLTAQTIDVNGYLNANWDVNAKHVYISNGFILVRSSSYLQVDGPAGFNGSVTLNGNSFFGGSAYIMNLRSQDGYIRAHNQIKALGGLHMEGQMLIGASVVATDNIRHSTNDPHAYIGFGPIRLVSSDPGARQVDLNHGTMVRGGINTMGYNINLGGGQVVGASNADLKHKFRPLSDDKFFRAAKELDVQSWSWKSGDQERHVGPTVQEFEDKFGYGVVEDGLSMMDMIGVLYKLSSVFAKKIDAIETKLSQESS